MDKIAQVLHWHAPFHPIGKWVEYENQAVIDKSNLHFRLLRVGWKNIEHIYHGVIHIDIKNDKIWIQEDYTKKGVANELTHEGVSKGKQDIVLAFQAPYRRADIGFATA